MKTMRKSLLMGIMALCVLSSNVFAFSDDNTSNNEATLIDGEFIQEANMTITKNDDDTTAIKLERTKKIGSKMNRSAEVENQYQKDSVTLIAMNDEEANQLQKELANVKSSGQVSDRHDGSFLGSSLDLRIRIVYSEKYVNSGAVAGTFYRMDSVTGTMSVNSGTIIDSGKMNLIAMGTSDAGYSYYQTKSFDFRGTYTTTYPSSWSYCSSGSSLSNVGANIECRAKRPGGTAKLYTFANNLG